MGQEKHYCMVQLLYFLHGLTITTATKTVKMYLTLCKPTTISKKKKEDRCCFTEQVSQCGRIGRIACLSSSCWCTVSSDSFESSHQPCHSEWAVQLHCRWVWVAEVPPHWLHGRINSRKRTPQVSAVVRSIFNTLSSVAVNTAHLRCLRKPQNTNNCY